MRNIAAGSFSKRYGVEEGVVFDAPTLEFSYKNDDLGDPLLNDDHALALGLGDKNILCHTHSPRRSQAPGQPIHHLDIGLLHAAQVPAAQENLGGLRHYLGGL